ncbi:MAG TPA: serine/threonine-protein kinase, partial [Anaerolineaceae bacterium]|nr:serine/threonine-protein kinase [Anaerolineaceae bacterium]
MGEDSIPPVTTQPLAEAPNSAQRLPQGSILENRYQIEDVVGSGGMGAVYRARDLHFNNVTKWVAVKEMANLNEDRITFESSQRNFEREANLLATLSHPSIPHIYDFFAKGAKSYLVMDFISGSNLEKILKQSTGFIPEDQVLQWAIELCAVLDYLHTHTPEPVVFRDMKPSNIIINPRNRVMLIDFGIAKAFKAGERGTVMGTEGYSPPEQYRGEFSPQVDIYALGATLHHVLTRKNPQLEAPFTFLERPIREVNPKVSPDFEAVVEKAVQYDAKDRFQSASDMMDALLKVKRPEVTALHQAAPRVNQPTHAAQDGKRPLWAFE